MLLSNVETIEPLSTSAINQACVRSCQWRIDWRWSSQGKGRKDGHKKKRSSEDGIEVEIEDRMNDFYLEKDKTTKQKSRTPLKNT